MELESSDEFPEQEMETSFCIAGQDILARGDQNRWKIRKNKMPF
jgi:hypothetical protein